MLQLTFDEFGLFSGSVISCGMQLQLLSLLYYIKN